MGEAGEFSRRVNGNIDDAIARDGRPIAEVYTAAGMSKNYFYTRMRGEKPFNTNDVEKIALVLRLDPFDLMSPRSNSDNVTYLGRQTPPAKLAADTKTRKADQQPHAD
ncbi:MAG: hypothetical protein CMH34_05375 [Microbacterium sp.]|nr:hypothetical protein [Microbacterium sp.]|tara:strand:+ start:359 stop:682 length:324 start_codon:yes stop_codon:yes gene_type:complete